MILRHKSIKFLTRDSRFLFGSAAWREFVVRVDDYLSSSMISVVNISISTSLFFHALAGNPALLEQQ